MVDLHAIESITYQEEANLRSLPFVLPRTIRTGENSVRIIVDQASTAVPALVEWAQQQNIKVKSLEEYLPSFDDVFVELVRREVKDE